MRISIALLILISSLALSVGCNKDFKRLLKSPNIALKDSMAEYYYKKKDFAHALELYEQLSAHYIGHPRQEAIQYHLAYCNYNLGYMDLASYIFRTYTENYPGSKHLEEAYYMYAYCHYLSSQDAELDQSNNVKAINELQLFINLFPNSTERVNTANGLIDKLRNIQTEKAYNNAKIYFKTGSYKASIVAFKNVLKEFPDIEQKEELEFLILKSHYLLAYNSIEEALIDGVYRKLKLERLESTLESYTYFIEIFPNSKYLGEAKNIERKTKTSITNLKKQYKLNG